MNFYPGFPSSILDLITLKEMKRQRLRRSGAQYAKPREEREEAEKMRENLGKFIKNRETSDVEVIQEAMDQDLTPR